MGRRFPNGYGGVSKLSGKRSKPYMAYVSEMTSEGVIIPPRTQNALKTDLESLQSASGIEEVTAVYAEAMMKLYADMPVEEYSDMLSKRLREEIRKRTFKSVQRKKPIGYFKTSQEANIALAEYNKNPYDLDKRNITFKEVYELAYKDANIDSKSNSTIKGYSSSFAKCAPIYDMKISEIKYTHLQEIIDSYSNMSASSLNNILITFNMVFSFAMKNELVEKNAAEFVKVKEHKEQGVKTPFSREEVQYLWNNLDWKYHIQNKSKLNGETISDILLILIYTGMRINELLSVRTEDVKLEERYINLLGTKTKAAKRLVPIHKKIIPLIEARLATGGEYLITDKNGKRIAYDQLNSKMLYQFCKQNKMNHTFHEARHSFATYTKASGLDSTLRQFIIGHANGVITDDVYTHPEVLLPELIKEIDKLEI